MRGPRLCAFILLLAAVLPSVVLIARPVPQAIAQGQLSAEERGWLERADRRDVNGWLHLRIEGAPFHRGFQYLSLIHI